jgi:hypothetical protein
MCCSIGAAGFRPSSRARRWALALRPEHHPRSDQSGHIESSQHAGHAAEGTARAAQLAPSAVTASAVGGSATRSVVANSLRTDDERLLYGTPRDRGRVLLDICGRTQLQTCGGGRREALQANQRPAHVLEHIKLKSIRDPTSVIKPLVLSDITELRKPRRVTAAVATALAAAEAAVTGSAATGCRRR